MSLSESEEFYQDEETGEWHDCVADYDYEICDAYPYPIRRRSNHRIVKECIDKSNGYVVCTLNKKKYLKHVIIAEQFVWNDDDLTKQYVDHIDKNRLNNHIDNLRFVSASENNRNRSSNKGVVYEYVDKIADDAIEITDYGNHHFEFYYYVEADDAFFYYNGVAYRKLHVNIDKQSDLAFVYMMNTDNKRVKVYLNKFKRLYGIDF